MNDDGPRSDELKPTRCPVCGKRFPSQEEAHQHLCFAHFKKMRCVTKRGRDYTAFQCPCGNRVMTLKMVELHLKKNRPFRKHYFDVLMGVKEKAGPG